MEQEREVYRKLLENSSGSILVTIPKKFATQLGFNGGELCKLTLKLQQKVIIMSKSAIGGNDE
jgi:hypothetical protein